MIEHHIQRKIIAKLVEKQSARFAELRPPHVDSNLYSYHLQSLMRQNYIIKDPQNRYALTAQGKLLAINVKLTRDEQLEQAHSVILLAVRRDKRWLLRRRLVQPMYGKIGFIHGEPSAGETIERQAAHILHDRTGLRAAFAVRGSGFISLWHGKQLESYIHFTLLETEKVTGTLSPKDSHGENMWLDDPDFSADAMIPSMERLSKALEQTKEIFFEEVAIRQTG